jgi:Cft2 family RNA processing exonuclease
MVIWVSFFAEPREILYEKAGEILKETGWYPMITGDYSFMEKSSLENLVRKIKSPSLEDLQTSFELGRLIHLKCLLSGNKGTSILLGTSTSNLLLDFGKKFDLNLDCMVDLFLLSHFHYDHCGGTVEAVERLNPRFIIMSQETLRFLGYRLLDTGRFRDFINIASRTICPPLGKTIGFNDKSGLMFLDANHIPGSLVSLFNFSDQQSLLYTGDFCIEGELGEINFKQVNSILGPTSQPRKMQAIVDSALIGREDVENSVKLAEIIVKIRSTIENGGHVVLIVKNVDVGFKIYVSLYESMFQGRKKISGTYLYMDNDIYLFTRSVRPAYFRRQLEKLGPKVASLLRQRKNLFETVVLFRNYYTERTRRNISFQLQRGRSLIFLNTLYSLGKLTELFKNLKLQLNKKDLIVTFGPAAEEIMLEGIPGPFQNGRELFCKDFGWSLHSREYILRDFLKSSVFDQVFLFHNSSSRLTPFIKSFSNDVKIDVLPENVEF